MPFDLIQYPGGSAPITTADSVPPAPVPIERLQDYSAWQANHPAEPLPGDDIDAEFDHGNDALNNVMARLALIQRDDGALANQSVGPDQLDPAVFGDLGETLQAAVDAAEASAAEAAASALAASLAAQEAADAASLIPTPVVPAQVGYVPIVDASGDYVLSPFDPSGDLVASVFGRLGNVVALAGDYTAAKITVVPVGTLAADDVQEALAELDSEKLSATLGAVSHADYAAVGMTQGTATPITTDQANVISAAAGVDEGLKLPPALAGMRVVVGNYCGVNTSVYPATGDQIDTQAVNTSFRLITSRGVEFVCLVDGRWSSNLGVAYGTVLPSALGAAAVGSSPTVSRADHVHPAADLATAQVTGRLPYSKLVQQAAATMLGNNTGALNDTAPLTVAQVQALLSVYTQAQVDALLANYFNLTQVTQLQKALRGAVVALTANVVTVPDMSLGNYFKASLNANYAIPNPTNAVAGQSGLFLLQQDATGGRVVTWAANYKFPGGAAPSNTLTANAKDVIPYYVNGAAEILCGNITADIR